MDLPLVKGLIEALEASSLHSVSYEKDGLRVALSRGPLPEAAPSAPSVGGVQPLPAMAETAPAGTQVTAPLVGSVFRAREPGAEPLVRVGDRVAQGDVLCLMEAMKMFSEIPAPCGGVVSHILFEDGQLAEFGMPLVILEPAT